MLKEFPINLCSIEEQQRIAAVLDKVSDLIALRKKQLEKLDELIKSRFVEMFGDPVSNPYGYKKVVLSELADIKIGPFGSLLHKEDYIEGGHPLLNPSHIIDSKVVPDNKLTISDKKYEELAAYQLKAGDCLEFIIDKEWMKADISLVKGEYYIDLLDYKLKDVLFARVRV